ncbi:Antigen, partial [Armadillidium vulgare]
MFIFLLLLFSEQSQYKFVNLDDFEAAQRFPHGNEVQPQFVKRMSGGEHEHSISVPGHQARTIYFPIVPVVTGEIVITVQASIPGSKISRTTVINSEAIGALQQHHTSMLLDLSSRAYLFTFLDIVNPGKTDFTSSPNAEISLFGDMVGGSSEDIISSNVLNLPEIGCEPVVFSILMTVLQLNHWVSLSQKPPKNEREIFKHISILYQTLISYQNYDGGFKYFKTSSTSSVWVTSLALRALNEVSIEWQKRIYVDHQVTDRALRFLMKQQSGNGAFWEPSGSLGVRILESPSSFIFNDITTNGLNLSSTALTIIQLMTLRELPEPLDEEVSRSIGRGRDWLERNLGVVASASHPLEVSLVALALHLMKSKRSEEAFNILARNARQEVKYVYWGEDLVPLPSYRVESQRPHLQPRKSHRHDSGNIAATACGLRVYASRGELLTPAIVRWLHYQRENDQGWMSTLDTLLAWEALHEYSSIKKLAKYTHLTVMVERMKTRQKQKIFYVSSDNVLHLQKYY